MKLDLSEKQFIDLINLKFKVFNPVLNYISYQDFQCIAACNRLSSGVVFPFPIALRSHNSELRQAEEIELNYKGFTFAHLNITEFVKLQNISEFSLKLFGTDSSSHPGVFAFQNEGDYLISGELNFVSSEFNEEDHGFTIPNQYKKLINEKGWKSVASFQTRNVPHLAHEHLIRVGLEVSDGMLLQPVVGIKKTGEFKSELIHKTYNFLINETLNQNLILYAPVKVNTLYAGPREALYQAIIRKNYGATKFIVGRDHAGVGTYYGKYDAQNFVTKFESEIEMEFLKLSGPYLCKKCEKIVTSKTCAHAKTNFRIEISGSAIRDLILQKKHIPIEWMRPGISKMLQNELDVFTNE